MTTIAVSWGLEESRTEYKTSSFFLISRSKDQWSNWKELDHSNQKYCYLHYIKWQMIWNFGNLISEGERPMFYTTRFGKRSVGGPPSIYYNNLEKLADQDQGRAANKFLEILEGWSTENFIFCKLANMLIVFQIPVCVTVTMSKVKLWFASRLARKTYIPAGHSFWPLKWFSQSSIINFYLWIGWLLQLLLENVVKKLFITFLPF